MRRLSLVFAIAVLLIGIPVQAQKQIRPIIQPAPGIQPAAASVLIQGENGEGYMRFNLKSGDFNCNLCEYGYEMKGVGEVKIDGCNVYFTAVTDQYSVFATVDMCGHQAKCVVQVLRIPEKGFEIEPITEYLIDSDMRNSKPDCSLAPQK